MKISPNLLLILFYMGFMRPIFFFFFLISFLFYTSDLQGFTIQQYKNKKNLKYKNTSTKQNSKLEETLYVSQQGLYK